MGYVPTRLKREICIESIITIHYFEYSSNFVFRGESHDFWEFLYVDRGKIQVTAGDASYTLSAGEIIFHEPLEFHAFQCLGTKPPNLVVMSFLCSSPLLDFFRHGVFRLTGSEQMIISRLLNTAEKCFSTPLNVPMVEQVLLRENQIPGYPQLISLYLEQFLLTVFQNRQSLPPQEQSVFIVRADDPAAPEKSVDKIVQYMEEHITDKLTLKEICSVFSLSCSTLENAFRREKKCAPMTFFAKMKIDRAKEFLREGTMNITEISYYFSFSSLPHFSRQFKQFTGYSPKEYQSSVKQLSLKFKKSNPVHRVIDTAKEP